MFRSPVVADPPTPQDFNRKSEVERLSSSRCRCSSSTCRRLVRGGLPISLTAIFLLPSTTLVGLRLLERCQATVR